MMFNILPDEIIFRIIDNPTFTLCDYLNIKNINHYFLDCFYKMENKYDLINQKIEKAEIKDLCKKQTSLKLFEWIFKNKYPIELDNIKLLIKYNRLDVIEKGIQYDLFHTILYNKFYIYSDHDFITDSFNHKLTDNLNPITYAATYNKINILDFLIKNNQNKTFQLEETLLNISIKHNNRELLIYILMNYYNDIKGTLNTKIKHIIHRISNCEDILFFLVLKKDINFNHKLLESCIMIGYNDLFYFLYDKIKIKQNHLLLKNCFEYGNIDIFKKIYNIGALSNEKFTELFLKIKSSETFIYFILNNYRSELDKNEKVINFCLKKNIDEYTLINLINNNFKYSLDDIQNVLNDKNINLLKIMVDKY